MAPILLKYNNYIIITNIIMIIIIVTIPKKGLIMIKRQFMKVDPQRNPIMKQRVKNPK